MIKIYWHRFWYWYHQKMCNYHKINDSGFQKQAFIMHRMRKKHHMMKLEQLEDYT